MSKTCSICGGKHFARGFCRKHYRQLPEVKKRRRDYDKAYYQRPEVKKRQRNYKNLRVPVIDCFEKDKPVTLEILCVRSGGSRGCVIKIIKDFEKLGLVVEVEKNVFKLNPNSAFRMAVDGYYRDAQRELARQETTSDNQGLKKNGVRRSGQ